MVIEPQPIVFIITEHGETCLYSTGDPIHFWVKEHVGMSIHNPRAIARVHV